MNIVIGSAFRNSAHACRSYMDRVAALRDASQGHTVSVSAVYGDSTDGTGEALLREAYSRNLALTLTECSHGGPVYGSTESLERMVALSKVGNAIFDSVRLHDDILFYVESDLLWDAHTARSLIDLAAMQEEGFDIFAPMVFAGWPFYDIFAFRKDGVRFSPFPPYHVGLHPGLTVVDSVGSCLAMRGDVARACRIRNDNVLIGWCEDARQHGYRIAVHSDLKVHHP